MSKGVIDVADLRHFTCYREDYLILFALTPALRPRFYESLHLESCNRRPRPFRRRTNGPRGAWNTAVCRRYRRCPFTRGPRFWIVLGDHRSGGFLVWQHFGSAGNLD